MTPGTLPARRSARAAPLPLFGRAVAFNSLTVAIALSPCFLKVKGRDPRPVYTSQQASRGAGAANVAAFYPQRAEMTRLGHYLPQAVRLSFRDAPKGAGPESIVPHKRRRNRFRARIFDAPRNDTIVRSRDELRPSFACDPPTEGAGNAGRLARPQPRAQR